MDIQNHFYGHSAVYAAHCGLPRPRHVAGLIQHGWTPVSPISTHFADLAGSAPTGNLFTWTHSSRGWTEAESAETTGFSSTAIGAPFLYLLDMVAAQEPQIEKTIDTVVFPFHGTRLVAVEGDQRAYAQEIYDREGPSTVCMHVDDLQRPDIVDAWTSSGHRITSAGERRDPNFLARVLWLLLSSRKVVSNRLATALVYGASAGIEVAIYGPHFQIAGISETSSESYLRKLWPEFYEKIDPADLRLIADKELGREYMRSSVGLRQVLGWQTPSPRPFFDYWIGAPLEKAQAVLGTKKRAVGPVINEVKLSPLHFLRHPLEHLPDALPRSASSRTVEPRMLVDP